MKKIIALDLDGTTLNASSSISEKTKNVLQQAMKEGHEVVIATGRPYRASAPFYETLQLQQPIINLNGAHIHLPHKHWEKEKHFVVKKELVLDILQQRTALGATFIATENSDAFYVDDVSKIDATFLATATDTYHLLSPKSLTTDPTSIMIGTSPHNAPYLTKQLDQQYGNDITIRTWGGPNTILELTQKGVQKAAGLEYLSHALGFSKENVIAFGDEHNDLEMLQWAGWGVAMKNGTQDVKAAANDITSFSNNEDGLANYLIKYLHLK